MLAYPTPTFNAKTILEGPGHRPLGRGAEAIVSNEIEAITPMNLVNCHTANGGFVGSRSKKFIQDPWREPGFDPVKGSPLSKPGSVGNVVDQAISMGRPTMAEPVNAELRAIMAILNGKVELPEHAGKLSAKQVESLGTKSKGPKSVPGALQVTQDFSETQNAMKKERMLNQAVSQGFSLEEANAAYGKIRVKEAEIALTKEQDPSVRLYDLIDSKVSGTQNGSVRGNDETGLFLAKGGNAIMFKKAEKKNEQIEEIMTRGAETMARGQLPKGMHQYIEEITTRGAEAMAHGELPEGMRQYVQRGRPKGSKNKAPRKKNPLDPKG